MGLGQGFDEVLSAARAAAPWAWDRLYRDLAPAVLGYLRARGASDPEDLAGEVFLEVVRNLARFTGDERQFRSWVLTIAHRRLVDDFRRRARHPEKIPLDDARLEASPLGDSEDEAMQRLGTGELREAIARLTPDQQDVLLLRILGEMTVAEIAKALNKREGAVKALQRRGLAALARHLSAQGVPL